MENNERHKQTEDELSQHLKDQLGFLSESAANYDKGNEQEYKRMAVSLRVICHDGPKASSNSKSLVTQLGLSKTLFLDSSFSYDENTVVPYKGLAAVRTGENRVTHAPILEDHPEVTYKSFDQWWDAVVIIDGKGNKFTRKDIVRAVADQDGGAHVDPTIAKEYADLSRHNSMAMTKNEGKGHEPFLGVEKVSIRQIAHEVLTTLMPDYKPEEVEPKEGFLVAGIKVQMGIPDNLQKAVKSDLPNIQPKIGRNDPCPCGSGKKYKKCHGA